MSTSHGLELLKQGVIYRVGDGQSIRIWRDNWIQRSPDMKVSGSIRMCRLRRVAHLINQDSHSWDETLVRRYFYPWDVDEILKIKLPASQTEDVLAWSQEKSGLFSVRSAYRLAMKLHHDVGAIGSSTSADGARDVWKKLWKLQIPPKVRVFSWKVVNNGLPTRANKNYRHIDTQAACELCGAANEDVFHALIHCPHAVALRHALSDVLELPGQDDLVDTCPDWLLGLIIKYPEDVMANFLMQMWRIWSVRNGVLKAGEKISIEGSVIFLTRYMDGLLSARQQYSAREGKGKGPAVVSTESSSVQKTKEDRRWVPPVHGKLKINVDGAYNVRTGAAGLGVVIRDATGQPLLMAWQRLFHCRDAEEAEASACIDGVRLAARWPDVSMVLESDAALVVTKLKTDGCDRSLIAGLVNDIREECRHLLNVEVRKIGREQNAVAHTLAQRACRLGESCVSFSQVPDCIKDLIVADRLVASVCNEPG